MLLDGLVASEDEEIFADTIARSPERKEAVEDTLMSILGVWSMMLSSFVRLPNGFRKVTIAYSRAHGKEAKDSISEGNLAGLIRGSGLLPAPGSQADAQDANLDDGIVQTAMKLVTLLSGARDTMRDYSGDLRSPSNSILLGKFGSNISSSQITYRLLDNMD